MKLTNPTDEALNMAFAIDVAKCGPDHKQYEGADYCNSAGAVLPWLEDCKGASCNFDAVYCNPGEWSVDCTNVESECDYPEWRTRNSARDTSFPRAAVIALLRAHGVEVEFTK